MSEASEPNGELALQTLAMPKDANANGDIFGGWLISQMDLACGISAERRAEGRVATLAIGGMTFVRPVGIGSTVSCYTRLLEVGNTSMKLAVEVWERDAVERQFHKVTEGHFTFVAIDADGRPRPVPKTPEG